MRCCISPVKYAFQAFLLFTITGCDRAPLSQAAQPVSAELWWSYLADYDGLPGSIVVNLALKARAPMRERPTLLVTGVSYQSSSENSGLPDAAELDFLKRLSTMRLKVIAQHSTAILAGTFTHKNERLDYIYVADSAGLEVALRSFYQTECPTRRTYINVKSDPQWLAYSDFLYPGAQTIEHNRTELIKLGH
jgi:hypothetical protein